MNLIGLPRAILDLYKHGVGDIIVGRLVRLPVATGIGNTREIENFLAGLSQRDSRARVRGIEYCDTTAKCGNRENADRREVALVVRQLELQRESFPRDIAFAKHEYAVVLKVDMEIAIHFLMKEAS